MNTAVSAMAAQINDFFFSQALLGGTLYLHAPPCRKATSSTSPTSPWVNSLGGNAYGLCDTLESGNAGNPWSLAAADSPDSVPTTGSMCDSDETFGSPYPGG